MRKRNKKQITNKKRPIQVTDMKMNEPKETLEQTKVALYEKNWENFFDNHIFNYKTSHFKGKFFDAINNSFGKTYCFPVHSGVHIETGDIVVLDNYCEAYPVDLLDTFDEEDAIVSEIIGVAIGVAYLSDAYTKEVVFVHSCTFIEFKNTAWTDCRITEQDICGPCYLENPFTVTKDGNHPMAGQIVSIDKDIVKVYVNLEWGEE